MPPYFGVFLLIFLLRLDSIASIKCDKTEIFVSSALFWISNESEIWEKDGFNGRLLPKDVTASILFELCTILLDATFCANIAFCIVKYDVNILSLPFTQLL